MGGLLYADDRFDEVRTMWEAGFAGARDTRDRRLGLPGLAGHPVRPTGGRA